MKFLKWALAVAFVWVIALVIVAPSEPEVPLTAEEQAARDRENQILSARGACRQFITQSLNDPSSAEFPGQEGWAVVESEPDLFEVIVNVRARNGFGALMLAGFRCVVRDEGENWRLVGLDEV